MANDDIHSSADRDTTAYSRRSWPRPSNGRGFWLRRVQPGEILAGIALVTGLLAAFGWRRYNPEPLITSLDARVTHNEHRIDSASAKMDVLLRVQCFNKTLTDRDKLLAGLKCNEAVP